MEAEEEIVGLLQLVPVPQGEGEQAGDLQHAEDELAAIQAIAVDPPHRRRVQQRSHEHAMIARHAKFKKRAMDQVAKSEEALGKARGTLDT